MSVDLSLMHLISEASLLVQLVMAILVLASVTSWMMIFRKWVMLKKASDAADDFEDRFWSGRDLSNLYSQVHAERHNASGMESIFMAGFTEFARMRKRTGIDPAAQLEGPHRAMRVALNREVDTLEGNLSFLATVGSISPYIGLFGTVWGIMNSFRGLSDVQQATIAMVAPGIAEALIATAMGLFAAIPAVIAYNRYSADVERLVNRFDNFSDEFYTILQRKVHSTR